MESMPGSVEERLARVTEAVASIRQILESALIELKHFEGEVFEYVTNDCTNQFNLDKYTSIS